jgi:hypothetical protein
MDDEERVRALRQLNIERWRVKQHALRIIAQERDQRQREAVLHKREKKHRRKIDGLYQLLLLWLASVPLLAPICCLALYGTGYAGT